MRGYWAESKRWKALGWVLGVVLSAAPLQAQKLTWLSDAFPAIHDISASGSTVVGYISVSLVCEPYGCGSTVSAFACGEFSFQCGGLDDRLTCVSDDGAVAAGVHHEVDRYYFCTHSEYYTTFRCTAQGAEHIADNAVPTDISADGSVIVGIAQSDDHTRVFRWTEAAGFQLLGIDYSGLSAPRVSDDGQVIVGTGLLNDGSRRRVMFRWTEATGMQDLGLPAQGTTVRFLSEDGSLMIGHIRTDHSTIIFRWSESAGLQFLGTLGGARAEVTGITWDGSVLVGWSQTASGQTHVFRWTEATGMQDLGPGDRIVISPDGLVMAWSIRGQRVIYWHQGRALSLSELPLLKKQGVHPGTVWGVSSDGRSLLISAADGRSWGDPCFPDGGHGFEGRCLLYITLPFGDANYDGVVDEADLLAVFFNFGSDCR